MNTYVDDISECMYVVKEDVQVCVQGEREREQILKKVRVSLVRYIMIKINILLVMYHRHYTVTNIHLKGKLLLTKKPPHVTETKTKIMKCKRSPDIPQQYPN